MAAKIGSYGPLNQALDNFNLTFTTGGDGDWFTTTMEYINDDEEADPDSARTGHISDNNEVWLQTTVDSGGSFKFWWAVYSEQNHDYLQFYIDGELKAAISGYVDWDQKSYNLSSGSHTLKWRYVKDGSGSEGADCGWVDWVQHPSSEPSPPDTLANAMDCDLSFTTGGDAQWSRSSMEPYYDHDCARSGSLDDDEQTWMQTTVDVNAQEQETITFYWKVSSEEDCDYLQFYVDNELQDEISGEEDWQQKIYTLNSGSHTLKWRYVKDGSEHEGWDCGYVDWLQAPGSTSPPPGLLAEALDCDLSIDSGGNDAWYLQSTVWYHDGDAARSSYSISNGEESNLDARVYVDGQETLTFYWKVSSEQNDDYLQFYIDGVLKDQISGEVDWHKKSYTVTGSGGHALKWRYVKDYTGSAGSDCGWVDLVQWTGPSPPQDPNNWDKITYNYDLSGRRIKKSVDGYKTTYCYDGGHVIAEYDGNGNLLRKYVYGPRVDEPVCMLEVADSNAAYYYHFDGLGSVVALSDSSGNTIQRYEYTVYGRVAAQDPNHPNPYMFTGRRFDFETGLYYYRARYYNPYIGRFLQTDPVGYSEVINWYLYCRNNPLIRVDPSGRLTIIPPILDPRELIPGWNPTGELPELDGNWDWEDYFTWYYYGEGREVDIHDTGLFDDFVNDPQIQGMMADFENEVISNAGDAYADNVALGVEHPGIGFAFANPEIGTYDFGQPSNWASWIVGLEGSEVIVLGDGDGTDGHGVYMGVTGVVNDDGTYEITFHYYLFDEFKAPWASLDFLETWPFNIETGTPYELFASWSHTVTGSFAEEDEED